MIAERGGADRRLLEAFTQITLRQRLELLVGRERRRRRGRRCVRLWAASGAQQHSSVAAIATTSRGTRGAIIAKPLAHKDAIANGARRYQLKCALAATPTILPLSIQFRSPALQALSQPDFARYAFGRLAGTLAWQMINVVAGFQVWKITRDPLDLGFIGLAQFLPFLALVLPGGQVADRFDRRIIIACAYTAELAGAAILLWFTLSGSTNVAIVFGAMVLLGVARAFWAPAGQAMTPNLVPRHHAARCRVGERRAVPGGRDRGPVDRRRARDLRLPRGVRHRLRAAHVHGDHDDQRAADASAGTGHAMALAQRARWASASW